jgi:hypothetical protein
MTSKLGALLLIALTVGSAGGTAACSAAPAAGDNTDTATQEQGTCTGGTHECAAWGATCAGSTLQTCVLDQNGCRKLVTQACSLGCDAGACKTCDAISVPKRSSSLATPTAFYESVVRSGNVAIASWRERNGEYTGDKRGFAAVDLTNPDALATLATTTTTPNEDANELRIEGNRVYGIAAYARVQIWDATNPSSLAPLGSYTPAAAPTALAVSGGIAYVGTRVGIDIVDMSPAAGPQLLSVIATSVPALAVVAAGTHVAVAGANGVEVIDVTDPANPAFVAKATIGGQLYGYVADPLAFDGQHAYVAATTSYDDTLWTTLYSLELTPAGTLETRGSLPGLSGGSSLAFDGGDLILSTGNGVAAIDVSDPTAPRWKKHVFLGSAVQGVTGSGPLLYTSGTEGVSAVDLGRASDVTLLPLPGADWLGGAVTKGSIAYLARSASGLVIEDVRDPKNPVVLSKTSMAATSIALDGFLAYVTVRDEGLRIFDIRSPWHPELVGLVSAPMVGQVSVDGGRAYAMCGIGYTCIFDVSNPTAPTLITQSDAIVKTTGSSSAWTTFAMRGSHLYLPRADKLVIVDLANAAAPVTLGQVALGGYDGDGGDDVRIAFTASGHAIVAYDCHTVAGDTCFDVVDASNPASPQKVATVARKLAMNNGFYQTLNASPQLSTMHVAGRHLFLTNQWGGVLVMDVADPLHPTEIGELWTLQPARDHFVSERFLTTYTDASFPFPAPEQHRDQVIELCK